MSDRLWRTSHYGRVSEALCLALDAPTLCLAPGADSAIAHGLGYFRMTGDREAVARLEAIALAMTRLQLILRDRDLDATARTRHELAALARDWLLASPLFPGADREAAIARAA